MLEESVSLWASMYSWLTPTVLFVFLNLMIGTIAFTSSSSKSADPHHSSATAAPAHHQIHRSPSLLHRLKSISFSSYRSPEPFSDNPHPGFSPDEQPLQQPASIEQNQPFLSRSPSVLQRIKSFNLYNYISQEPTSFSSYDAPPSPPHTQETEQSAQTQETLEEAEAEEDVIGETNPTLEEVYSKLHVGDVNHVTRTMSDTEPAGGFIPPKLPKKMRKSASTKSPFAHFEEEDIAVVEARRPATVREGRVTVAEEDGGAADEEVDAKADDFINRFKQQLKLQRIDSLMRYKEMVKKGSEK